MTTFKWASRVSGNWADAADWTPQTVPGSSDRALIEAAGTYGVTLDAAEAVDSLTINASGAVLTDTGTLAVGGDLKVLAGAFDLAAAGEIEGGTISAQGGAFDWQGGVLDGVTYRGAMTLAPGQSVSVQGSFMISSLAGGQGVIDMSAGDCVFYAAQAPVAGTIYIANVTFVLGSGSTITAGVYPTQFNIEDQLFQNSTIISVVGVDAILNSDNSFGGIEDRGSLILEPDSSLIIGGGYGKQFRIDGLTTVMKGATLFAGDPSVTQVDSFANFHNGNLRLGTFDIQAGGTLRFSCGSANAMQHVVLLTTALTLGGPGAVVESFSDEDDATLPMEQTLTRISAAGELQVLGGRGYAGTTTLFNQGTIDLGGGTFSEATLTNSGTVQGFGTISAPIADGSGKTIAASGGVLDVTGAVSGSGRFVVGAGATLRFEAAATAITASFAGAGGVLGFADPDAFAGKVAGFAAGDTIDLIGILATSVSRMPGTETLVFKNGAATVASLTLAGNYVHDTFSLAADGHGGTNVTVAATPAKLAQAVAGMARTGSAAAGAAGAAAQRASTSLATLAASAR